MHREIWKSFYGEIPKGFHIHHIDKCKENNHISNLQALPAVDHHRLHGSKPKAKEWARKLCERIRPLTKEWHASEKGLEWHRQHAKEMGLGKWAAVQHECDQCKKEFESTKLSNTKFCSNVCKSKWRRASGLDDIKYPCEWCSNSFTKNKYAKTIHCSKSCAAKTRESQKH